MGITSFFTTKYTVDDDYDNDNNNNNTLLLFAMNIMLTITIESPIIKLVTKTSSLTFFSLLFLLNTNTWLGESFEFWSKSFVSISNFLNSSFLSYNFMQLYCSQDSRMALTFRSDKVGSRVTSFMITRATIYPCNRT